MDNYERPVGPFAATAALNQTHGFIAFAVPKTLVGIDGDFNNHPDLGLLTLLDESGRQKLTQIYELEQRMVKNDDVFTFADINISYNPETQRASVEMSIADRYLALELQKLLEQAGQDLDYRMPAEPTATITRVPATSSFWFELYLNSLLKPLRLHFPEIPMLGTPTSSPLARVGLALALQAPSPEFLQALGLEIEPIISQIQETLSRLQEVEQRIKSAAQAVKDLE